MINPKITPARLNKAVQEVCICLQEKYACNHRWEDLDENILWRELVACILGSRVRYDVAYSAIERMGMANLFSDIQIKAKQPLYEKAVFNVLMQHTSSEDASCPQRRYPFPSIRAGQIGTAAQTIYSKSGTIKSLFEEAQDERDARRHLAREVSGLGPKQASLFLRNIGFTTQVAVLDVHVLTY
jgi:N-glycosylase/DNA lyase